jgi:hypothetical protein
MVSFNCLAGLNLTFKEAGIIIFSLVCGFNPVRSFLFETANFPKPGIATSSPSIRL